MADKIKFSNDASALLASSVIAGDTVIALEAGKGALFPSPSGGQYFLAAIQDADGNLEVVKCTSRTSDSLTVARGQESTTAQSWTGGAARLELRVTKGTMEEMLQKNGGTMTGTLDMDGHTINDAVVDGDDTVIQGGQIVGVPIRGALDDSSNEILVPDDGSRATAGGAAIVTEADLASNQGLNLLPIGSIIMWYGVLASLPAGWQNCDGTNGSPDLRGRFPVGVDGTTYSLGDGGGSATASGTTGAGGAHTPTGVAASHVLTEAELPAHNHGLRGDTNTTTTATSGLGASDVRSVAGRTANFSTDYVQNAANTGQQLVEDAGGGQGHTHSVSFDAVADHTHSLSSVATIPPYRAIYFIMRVS